MSWCDRRAVLAGLVLAGCGFTPVYGPGGSAEGLSGRIAFDAPRDAQGFALVRQLERRLGIADAPGFQLSASIFLSEDDLGITPGQEITRFNLLGRVRFTVRNLETGEIATSGEVESFTSYSATGTPFATQTARADARERLMTILADEIVSRLLVTADEWLP